MRQGLSGPNRAMQPRCAMRFESRTPKSLAMRKVLFASDAKTHSLDLKSQENARKKGLRKSCDVGLRCENRVVFLRSSDAKCLRFGCGNGGEGSCRGAGGDSAVQPHNVGGVRGEEGHTQEHTQEHTREFCTYPLATYPLKSARN